MKVKGLYMGSTKISPEKTAGQIEEVLTKHKATAIQKRYDDGEIVALDFAINVNEQDLFFSLPIRYEAILEIIKKYHTPSEAEAARARRVAWRQVLRWVEAQLAMVEVEMVKLEEVFLPYLITPKGTLYEQISEKGFKQIGYEG